MLEGWKAGQIIEDRYEILAPIGAGGMGSVYKARDLELGRTVAIKLLNRARLLGASEESIARLRREGQALSKLHHENVLAVYSMSIWQNTCPFLVLEYINGNTLKQLIEASGPVAWPKALKLVSQICAGLSAAHEIGIIHRDVKSENVLLAPTANNELLAKLADFGLCRIEAEEQAQLTQTGSLLGSAYYLAPEIPSAARVTTAVDVYSLACLMHELLTASYVFEGNSAPEIIYKHCHSPAPKLSDKIPGYPWPVGLEKIIQRCLEKSAEKRPTLNELKASLDELILSGATQNIIAPGRQSQPQKNPGALKTVYLGSVLSLFLIVACAFYLQTAEGASRLLSSFLGRQLPGQIFLPYLQHDLAILTAEKKEAEFKQLCLALLDAPPPRLSNFDRIKLLFMLNQASAMFSDKRLSIRTALDGFAAQTMILHRIAQARTQVPELSQLQDQIFATAAELQTLPLSKSEWRQIRGNCENILWCGEGNFLAGVSKEFDDLFTTPFRYQLHKLYGNSLKATAGSGPKEQQQLALVLSRIGAGESDLGLLDQAFKHFRESAALYLSSGNSYFQAQTNTSAGQCLLCAEDFTGSRKLLDACLDKSNVSYIQEPYQTNFCIWYCNHYFSQGDYLAVSRFILPRLASLRQQCTDVPVNLAQYMQCCGFAALSLCRLDKDAAADLITKICKTDRNVVRHCPEALQILQWLIAAEKRDDSILRSSNSKFVDESFLKKWAVVELGKNQIIIDNLRMPPAPIDDRFRQNNLGNPADRFDYIICLLLDSLVRLRSARDPAARQQAIAAIPERISNYQQFHQGPRGSFMLDPEMFIQLFQEFQRAEPGLLHDKTAAAAGKLLRQTLEQRRLIKPGSNHVDPAAQRFEPDEWNRLWKNFSEQEARYVPDLKSAEDMMDLVGKRSRKRLRSNIIQDSARPTQ